jgi:hypothetical protein
MPAQRVRIVLISAAPGDDERVYGRTRRRPTAPTTRGSGTSCARRDPRRVPREVVARLVIVSPRRATTVVVR